MGNPAPKGKMYSNLNLWFVTRELEQLDRYLDLLATAVSDNIKQFNVSIAELEKQVMTEDEREDFNDYIISVYQEIEGDFPRLLYSSFVVGWYSFMESKLIGFCKLRKLKITMSIQDNENFQKGIKRAYNFLSRSANYQIDNEHWKELTKVGYIRNKIVHDNGVLSSSRVNETGKSPISKKLLGGVTVYLNMDEELYKYFQKYELLEINQGFKVNPNFNYCKHLIPRS